MKSDRVVGTLRIQTDGRMQVGKTALHEALQAFNGENVVITIAVRQIIRLSGSGSAEPAEGTNQ